MFEKHGRAGLSHVRPRVDSVSALAMAHISKAHIQLTGISFALLNKRQTDPRYLA